MEQCSGCGGLHQIVAGPVHDYMASSPGCWQTYGIILAKEYSNPKLFAAIHRLSVDAFALQHPGNPDDNRALQSVFIHYLSLHLIFEKGFTNKQATKALQRLSSLDYPSYQTPPKSFEFTSADFDCSDYEEHVQSAERWARTSYKAWDSLKAFAIQFCAANEF